MALTLMWLRLEVRRHWRSLLVLTVLIGLATGTVLTAVTGARRGASAVERLHDTTLPATVVVTPFVPGFDWDAVRSLPQVESLSTFPAFTSVVIDEAPDGTITPFVPADDDAMRTIERPVVLAGRLADPTRADEAVVTANFVTAYGYGVGDTVTLRLPTVAESDAAIISADPAAQEHPTGPVVRIHLVGVVRSPWYSDGVGAPGRLIPSAGLIDRYRANVLGSADQVPLQAIVRLRAGTADLPAFRAALATIAGRPDIEVVNRADIATLAQDGARFESACLLAFGIAALLASAVLVGVSLARSTTSTAADLRALSMLGLTRGQATRLAAAGPAVAGVLGTSLGVGLAVVMSRWLPFGAAARFEPDPGTDADWQVLGIGLVVVPALVLFAAAGTARLASARARTRQDGWRRSAIASAAARLGLPVAVVLGARFALEPGQGARSVPVRSAQLAAVTGVLGVLAAVTFSAGVGDAGRHPERFGQTYQLIVIFGHNGEDTHPSDDVLDALAGVDGVRSVIDLRLSAADTGDLSVTSFSYDPVGGQAPLVLTSGSLPTAADEVTLAPASARRLDATVGSTVVFTGDAGSLRLTVTGIGFVPETYATGYDDGAWLTADGYRSLFTSFKEHVGLITLRPGVDPAEVLPALEEAGASAAGGAGVGIIPPLPPGRMGEIQNVRVLPVLLAGFLGVLAIGGAGHAIATAVRRRRHDLAILRAFGLTPGQCRVAVLTHAAALATTGLAIGVPLGIALGRTLWRTVADYAPLDYRSPVAALALILVVPVTALLAALLAVLPARRAARLRVSHILRAE